MSIKRRSGGKVVACELETNTYKQIGQSTDNSVCIEMDLLQVGSEPIGMRCPYCQEDMMTRATYRNSMLTHIIALVLGILFCLWTPMAPFVLFILFQFGMVFLINLFKSFSGVKYSMVFYVDANEVECRAAEWLCCCIIPYVSKRWKNVEHYCPNCSKFLGVYSRKSII